jgi:hypothetical protein
MNTESEKRNPARAFVDLLDELRDGDAAIDASEALTKLLAQVRDRCEPGSITLKISFKPASSGKVLAITDEVTVKAPKVKRDDTLMFCDKDGNLSKDNYEQGKLPLKETPRDEREIKKMPKEDAPQFRVLA